MTKNSVPAVFILESLSLQNENQRLLEGEIISKILHLNDIECKYFYFRTKKELSELIKIFKKSRYRYLHLSCHGGEDKIHFTLDIVSYNEFANIMKGYLEKRRLFISACSTANKRLSDALFPKCKPYSMSGPIDDIEFRQAAILWASFYHLMFKQNDMSMNKGDIAANFQKVANMFEQSLNFFYRTKSNSVKHEIIRAKETVATEFSDLLTED